MLLGIGATAQTTPNGVTVGSLHNAVYASPLTVEQGGSAKMKICVKADFAVTAVQFDLMLPKGVTAATDGNNLSIDMLDYKPSHTIVQRTFDGKTRVICYSKSNNILTSAKSNEAVMSLSISVADDMQIGDDADITLENIVLAGTTYTVNDALPSVSTPLSVKKKPVEGVTGEDVNIAVEQPGTLPDYLVDPYIIRSLTVRGGLNGTDIDFIRRLPRLENLNISGAWIEHGGIAYRDNLYTSDLVIGDQMFADMPVLQSLHLCDSTKEVGKRVIANDKNLRYVYWTPRAAVPEDVLGFVPTNCLIFCDRNTNVYAKTNVVKNGRIDRLDLIDNMPFYSPESFEAGIVTYTREFSKRTYIERESGWEGIVLPFDVQYYYNLGNQQIRPMDYYDPTLIPFWLATYGSGGWVHADKMKANTPYIISMPNSPDYPSQFNITGNVMFFAYDAKIYPTANATGTGSGYRKLVPSFEPRPASNYIYTLNDNAEGSYVPGSVFVRYDRDVRPFESYMTGEDDLLSKYIFIRGLNGSDDNADGIDAVEQTGAQDSSAKYYSVTGSQLTAPQRGVNIVRRNGNNTIKIIKK